MANDFDRSRSDEFYKAKGLKRVSVTMTEGTINFLEDKRQEFLDIKPTKQGDVVDAMAAVYMSDPKFAAAVDAQIRFILDSKVVLKAGRKEGWRKEKESE